MNPTPPNSTLDEPLPGQLRRLLAEVAAGLRSQPVPLDPALLAVVLRGLAELCRLVQARGQEAGAQPPVLFSDNPVITETLGMWATRLACLASEQQQAAGVARVRRA